MRIATEVLVEKYKDHLFAAAFNVCKNAADADAAGAGYFSSISYNQQTI